MSRLVVVGAGLALAGCSFSAAESPDAAGARDAATPPDASTRWSAPVLVELTGGFFAVDDPTLTADGLEMLFAGIRDGGLDESLYLVRRPSPSEPWTTPIEQTGLGTDTTLESNVDVLPDGLRLSYSRNVNNGSGTDLFFATRDTRTANFGNPTRSASLSSGQGEYGMWIDPTLLTAIICSNRPDTTHEALFSASRGAINQSFTSPARITELDSPADECDPHLPDPLTMYFTRNTAAGSLDLDLYVTHRATIDAAWDAPTRIDELSLPGVRDSDPWVNAAQTEIYFSSNRSGVDRIYVSRREISAR